MKRTVVALLLTLIGMALPTLAADPEIGLSSAHSSGVYESRPVPPSPPSWKWSLAPFVASQGLDMASSYGMRELNPLLAGPQQQFGSKAVLVKAGVTAAFVGVEYLIVKAHPGAAKAFNKINWSGAALTTGFAAHNWAIR